MSKGNFTIEALNRENYDTWRMQMEAILIKNDCFGYVLGKIEQPSDEKEVLAWKEADAKAKADIILCVAKENYDVVMILEDDVRFEPFFNQKMIALINELKNLPFQWDLVYLGRKKLDEKGEDPVEGTSHLVWAGYSYWTLGYLLSSQGAKKLVAQDPLSNILPVDEYLPILYDKHPADDWKRFFPVRDVIALSAEPLVLYPAWYLHEEGYISDTEDSPTVTTHRPEL